MQEIQDRRIPWPTVTYKSQEPFGWLSGKGGCKCTIQYSAQTSILHFILYACTPFCTLSIGSTSSARVSYTLDGFFQDLRIVTVIQVTNYLYSSRNKQSLHHPTLAFTKCSLGSRWQLPQWNQICQGVSCPCLNSYSLSLCCLNCTLQNVYCGLFGNA